MKPAVIKNTVNHEVLITESLMDFDNRENLKLTSRKQTNKPYPSGIPSSQSPVAIGDLLLAVPCLVRGAFVMWTPEGRG